MLLFLGAINAFLLPMVPRDERLHASRGRLIDSLKQANTVKEVEATVSQLGEIKDPKLLTIAMSSYRRVRQPGRALDLFYDAQRRGVEPNEISNGAAISACPERA